MSEKKTRKSVPRPNSGRRAADGAVDLVKVGFMLEPAQHEWIKANGSGALRQLIQTRIDAERKNKWIYIVELDNGEWYAVTKNQDEARKSMNTWNAWKPGEARMFKAFAVEQKDVADPAERVRKALAAKNLAEMTDSQRRYWIRQCEQYEIPVPEPLKAL